MAQQRTLGLGWLVSINNSGNNASPTWQPLGMSNQKTLDHQMKSSMVDVSGKGDAGYKSFIPGMGEIKVVVDFSLITSDAAYLKLKDNYFKQHSTNTTVKIAAESYIQITRADGTTYVYNAWVESFDENAPAEKELTGKVTFQVDGPPVTFSI